MKFQCDNLKCDTKNFKAKPTIDERTKCPRCKQWANCFGYSSKDFHIRKIDLMLIKINKSSLTDNQYVELEKKKIKELKEIVKALEIEMEDLHEC